MLLHPLERGLFVIDDGCHARPVSHVAPGRGELGSVQHPAQIFLQPLGLLLGALPAGSQRQLLLPDGLGLGGQVLDPAGHVLDLLVSLHGQRVQRVQVGDLTVLVYQRQDGGIDLIDIHTCIPYSSLNTLVMSLGVM